jgi:hypothetical protein
LWSFSSSLAPAVGAKEEERRTLDGNRSSRGDLPPHSNLHASHQNTASREFSYDYSAQDKNLFHPFSKQQRRQSWARGELGGGGRLSKREGKKRGGGHQNSLPFMHHKKQMNSRDSNPTCK